MGKRLQCKGYVIRSAGFGDCYYAGTVKVGKGVFPYWMHPATESLVFESKKRAAEVQLQLLKKRKRKTHLCQLWIQEEKSVVVIEATLFQRRRDPVISTHYQQDTATFLLTFGTPYQKEVAIYQLLKTQASAAD
jgi:hypothetical protein